MEVKDPKFPDVLLDQVCSLLKGSWSCAEEEDMRSIRIENPEGKYEIVLGLRDDYCLVSFEPFASRYTVIKVMFRCDVIVIHTHSSVPSLDGFDTIRFLEKIGQENVVRLIVTPRNDGSIYSLEYGF